jgi:hypothetical protein
VQLRATPDLDHLRRQAKNLLAGPQDSDPAATLTVAQASLPRRRPLST